ncbi:MAG: HPr family phosphocarrier protein [Nitrospirota bacterium]
MVEKTIRIQNRLGLHARAAALFVRTVNQFASSITVEKDGIEVNGKSIMGIMMLAAAKGTEVLVRARGNDEAEAVTEIEKLINAKFHEEA